MKKPNYDKRPVVHINGDFHCAVGWSTILGELIAHDPKSPIMVFECYHGVDISDLEKNIKAQFHSAICINAAFAYKSEEEINKLTEQDVTDDRIFGYRTRLKMLDFMDSSGIGEIRKRIDERKGQPVIIYGAGASMIPKEYDVFVYLDMARWEIQQRMRAGTVGNLGVSNQELEISRRYKRAYFVDWLICDRLKKNTVDKWHYVIDANEIDEPKMVESTAFQAAMSQTISRPFRVVPFFDPGPWGGQWMRSVCDLEDGPPNYAWCFDCVPEENSVLFDFNGTSVELPSVNLVYFRPKGLLGESVYARFGDEFPIRFDFLDTMGGGNLSLQVHPLTQFIQEHFGMHYTQDESYYMLDAEEDAVVYLGLKSGVDSTAMMADLRKAQDDSNVLFDADKYVEKWPARKHDHFLIPAGTVHCSGENSMVLEISATPYIFTFKLWDWGRLGLDGLPRPINIDRGDQSIQWDRTTDWVKTNLINRIEPKGKGDGWRSEKTGLHETEFIETIRHWFTGTVLHNTGGNLNVLNLVEGREAIVESPENKFRPFVVHYAETFIVPANVGAYTIRPYGESDGMECGTIKAYVK